MTLDLAAIKERATMLPWGLWAFRDDVRALVTRIETLEKENRDLENLLAKAGKALRPFKRLVHDIGVTAPGAPDGWPTDGLLHQEDVDWETVALRYSDLRNVVAALTEIEGGEK